MRALANSILATLFVLVLLLVLPLVVVFGVPEFLPAVASSGDPHGTTDPLRSERIGVGQSAGYVPHDLFAGFSDGAADHGRSFVATDGRSEFDVQRASSTRPQPVGRPRSDDPLDGWEFDDSGRALPANDRPPSRVQAAVTSSTQPIGTDRGAYVTGDSVSVDGPARTPPRPSHAPDVDGQQRFRRKRSGSPEARPPAAVPVDTASLDWNQAVARLRELGIRDYKLTPGSDGDDFHFACIYTPANGSRVTHRFEAEGTEPLHAVRAVLAQIDDWSSRRR